jgi:hypothetical protein
MSNNTEDPIVLDTMPDPYYLVEGVPALIRVKGAQATVHGVTLTPAQAARTVTLGDHPVSPILVNHMGNVTNPTCPLLGNRVTVGSDGTDVTLTYNGSAFDTLSPFAMDVIVHDLAWVQNGRMSIHGFQDSHGATIVSLPLAPVTKPRVQSVYPSSITNDGATKTISLQLVRPIPHTPATNVILSFSPSDAFSPVPGSSSISPVEKLDFQGNLVGWDFRVNVNPAINGPVSVSFSMSTASVRYLTNNGSTTGSITWYTNQSGGTINVAKDTVAPVITGISFTAPSGVSAPATASCPAMLSRMISYPNTTLNRTVVVSKGYLDVTATVTNERPGDLASVLFTLKDVQYGKVFTSADHGTVTSSPETPVVSGGVTLYRTNYTWRLQLNDYGLYYAVSSHQFTFSATATDKTGNATTYDDQTVVVDGNLYKQNKLGRGTIINHISMTNSVPYSGALGDTTWIPNTTFVTPITLVASEAAFARKYQQSKFSEMLSHCFVNRCEMFIDGVSHEISSTLLDDPVNSYYGFVFTQISPGDITNGTHLATFKFYTVDNEVSDPVGYNFSIRDAIIFCFAPNTYVATPTGPVRIVDLAIGDRVYSIPENGGSLSINKVENVIVTDGQHSTLSINGILTTPEHPWHDGEQWVRAGSLRSAVAVDLTTRESVVVPAVTLAGAVLPQVVNLTVADDHTFLVAATPEGPWYWVHNKILRNPSPDINLN